MPTLASSAHQVPASSSAVASTAASVIARGSKRAEPRSWAWPATGAATAGGAAGHELSAQRYTSTWVQL